MIIAFAGKKGSGKSTAARYVRHHARFIQMSFADPIREMLSVLIEPECLRTNLKNYAKWDIGGKSPREAMQTLGTEWGRQMIHEDLWVIHMVKRMAVEHEAGNHDFVIDDLRFPNELDMVRRYDGKVIWVCRGDEPEDTHASENSIDPSMCDYVLTNDGDLFDLEDDLTYILDLFL